MVQVRAKYDGKVLIPAEPLDVPAGTEVNVFVHHRAALHDPHPDPMAALCHAEPIDEADALHVDPLDAVAPDFVHKPGSAEGLFEVPDDFDDIPPEYEVAA
jgi:hypothetical protein